VVQKRCLIPQVALVAADSLEIFAAGEDEAEVVAANGATTHGMAAVTVRITETDPTSGTSEAASENEYTRGSARGSENGNETSVIESTSHHVAAGHHPHRYGHGLHRPEEISGIPETCLWELTPSAQDAAPEMGLSRLVRPIRIPCLLRHPSVADLAAAEDEAEDEDEGIGTRGAAGTGEISTMTEIGTHEVGLRKADGDGNRMTGNVGTVGTRIRLGTFGMIARSGTGKIGSARLSARSWTGYHTSLRLQRMSRPRPWPPQLRPLARCRAVSRRQQKFNHLPGSPRRPAREH
jgi:hypothetical protein